MAPNPIIQTLDAATERAASRAAAVEAAAEFMQDFPGVREAVVAPQRRQQLGELVLTSVEHVVADFRNEQERLAREEALRDKRSADEVEAAEAVQS